MVRNGWVRGLKLLVLELDSPKIPANFKLSRWWQLKYFLFSPLFGEMIPIDYFFSKGLVQPPTSYFLKHLPPKSPPHSSTELLWQKIGGQEETGTLPKFKHIFLLGQWLNFIFFLDYIFSRENKVHFFFQGPLAEWVLVMSKKTFT